MPSQFRKLFEPITVGSIEVKNRLVMGPMEIGRASVSGAITEELIDHYTELAKGGVGLIIVEGTCVERTLGAIGPDPRTAIDSDVFIAGLNDLVESVHRYGTKIAIQFQHAGSLAIAGGVKYPVSASAIPIRLGLNARALTITEIEAIEEDYAEAARRAKTAGFDAIDINCGAGILIAQFLSPRTNKRTDSYGGELEGRMKFLTETIQRIQGKVGKDYPIFVDHPADEFVEGGITLEESKIIAKTLEELGIVAFNIHTGVIDPRFMHLMMPPAAMPQGIQVRYAEETKRVLSRAKVMVGRKIQDPAYANRIIEEGKADLIVLGRQLFTDPEVVRKWAEGRLNEVRECIYCNRCITNALQGIAVRCTVNAALGRGANYRPTPALKPKRVLIVGGGPAGMEAARVAALRGHKVTLYEKGGRLGGQLNLACVPPYKREIKSLIKYLSNQIGKLEVRIETRKAVTKEVVKKEKPEVIILATGAIPIIPDIPGIKKNIVKTAWDILAGKAEAGEKVAVIGGSQVGLETADYLSENGKKVTIVELLPEAGTDVEPITKSLLLERLSSHGVNLLTNTELEQITNHGIVIANDHGRKTVEVNTVVLAVGAKPNKQLEELKKEGVWEVYSIGDCVTPRKALEAIDEGYWVSMQI